MTDIDFKSSTHPKHYLIHKYWGRKAHNLIQHLVISNTKPGDVVLDPYMGSGVSVIEANKAGRVGIGYDLNPISALITRVTLTPIDVAALLSLGKQIVDEMPEDLVNLSTTKCPNCGHSARYSNNVWESTKLLRVKVSCPHDGLVKCDARKIDIQKTALAAGLVKKMRDAGEIHFPDFELFQFVRRSGVKTLSGLFSSRNLAQVSYIHRAINSVSDVGLRDALRVAFTSMLPNVSRMIPADPVQVTGKSGWQISKFWVPTVHTEKDVSTSFQARVSKVASGIQEMSNLRTASEFLTFTQSSEDLHQLASSSVDLIIADPPYGDSIAYLGLSMFWNAWFNPEVEYESEIIIDSTRGKGLSDYSERLRKTFKEMRRVIAQKGKLIVTFNNRHMKYWKPLIEAIDAAGFELVSVDWIDQAVRSGTQGINHQNTLHGDFIYTYKPVKVSHRKHATALGSDLVKKTLLELSENNNLITSAQLYVALIPRLVREMAFYDGSGNLLDIDKEVAKYCDYIKRDSLGDGISGWILRGAYEDH
jgi:DNA modification methylase